jgi:hypothetical protein
MVRCARPDAGNSYLATVVCPVRSRRPGFQRRLVGSNHAPFTLSLKIQPKDALIITDSREALPRAISRIADKAIALDTVDGVRLRPETSIGQVRPIVQIVTPPEPIGRPDHAQRQDQKPRMRV